MKGHTRVDMTGHEWASARGHDGQTRKVGRVRERGQDLEAGCQVRRSAEETSVSNDCENERGPGQRTLPLRVKVSTRIKYYPSNGSLSWSLVSSPLIVNSRKRF